ncbi:PREDICTED: piggyBac transposable element-derived protein 5 [Myotis davidii]|uniref:piggyBac transposable element-derived protein 5 n=1 Tax=Myotis davidii TaxID=225400 RepID=UPI000767AC56|nr:PREDICTED: piggyBac transposable element-derived protein 5 [Myotis davidii]
MPPSASALDFFQLFVPDNMLKNMVVQTNLYARKFQERFGSDGAWADVTLAEMKAFLGYMVSTSISHCESVLSIWSGGFYSNRGLAGGMSQARFEKILKYFHVVAFRSSQAAHGLYKVQPFLDALQSSFDVAFRPSQTQVLHEPLIDEDPVFIATCTERELRKRKKRKFSLWVRQCSATGFIVQIYVHLKEGAGPDGLDALKNKPQLHGAVARNLCRNAAGKNYIVFTGPSITSLALFEEFEKQGLSRGKRREPGPARKVVLGEVGVERRPHSPCEEAFPGSRSLQPRPGPAGHRRVIIKRRSGEVPCPLAVEAFAAHLSYICRYDDKYTPSALWFTRTPGGWDRHGCVTGRAHEGPGLTLCPAGVIIKRRSGEVPCPLAVEAFAAHLSYICRYDDKYSKYFIFHKPNKTWQQVFWFAVSIAVNNAYILYKLSDAYHAQRYSRAQFGERLVRELLGLEDASPTP